jgi:hypothetical protein
MRIATIVVCLAAPLLAAQDIKFPASLDRLADKADEVVDVTLDANLLQLASRFLSQKDADQAKVKKLVGGLKGVYVRSFEFSRPGEYAEADVESIRSQLKSPAWSRIVTVRNKRGGGDNAEVYIRTENGQIAGLTVLAAEPKELTIVNIVGLITPEDLADLGGNFGIPKIDGVSNKSSKKATTEKKEEE